MNYKDITAIITTFRSEHKINSCINSLPSSMQIIVIENSNDKNFQKELINKYQNVDCILTGENKGYATANNIGLAKVKTKFALILNPDVVLEKDCIDNFLISAKNYNDFWLIGSSSNHNQEKIFEADYIKGHLMFFNLQKFNNQFFDENYFLYLEEIDLCKIVKKKNGRIFQDPSLKVTHEGAQSVNTNLKLELEKNRNWHWMWSTYYFQKKHNGLFIALIIIFPKIISSLLKMIFFLLILNKNKRDIYFSRLSGIFNSVLGKKSWRRPSID